MKPRTHQPLRLDDPVISRLTRQPGRVLVADDEAMNRDILRDPLEAHGYGVVEAEDGEKALQVVLQDPPDLVLLDVMMPGMDGFSVCRRIKNNPITATIPVLIVTALSDREARIQGIESGADDFLTKPLDIPEVMLRVHNTIYSKRLYDKSREDYEKLRELERLREMFTHMLVHDLRSPLAGVSGCLELLRMKVTTQADQDSTDLTDNALAVTFSLTEMISSLLDVGRMEEGKMPMRKRDTDLRGVIRGATDGLRGMAKMSGMQIHFLPPDQPVTVSCDPDLLGRVVGNLVGNAIRYTGSGSDVRVALESRPDGARITVIDNGPGIPPEFRDKIFEKFGQVNTDRPHQKYSSGLGLTFCKLVVESHGGRIGVDSEVGKGSTFWFELP